MLPVAESVRIPIYRWGAPSSGAAVVLGIGGVFAGSALYNALIHAPGRPLHALALVAMMLASSAVGVAIGLAFRRRARRPLAVLRIGPGSVELLDRQARPTAALPLAQLPVAEGWHERGPLYSKNAFHTLVLELGGRWAITSLSATVVEPDFCRRDDHVAPTVAVTDLDYLRLRRLLLPDRAAALAPHMARYEAALQQAGIGDRHPGM